MNKSHHDGYTLKRRQQSVEIIIFPLYSHVNLVLQSQTRSDNVSNMSK